MKDNSLIKFLHRVSALIILAFILMHLGNHLAAVVGFEFYQEYMSKARQLYRHPILEPLLVILIFAQSYTGVHLAVMSFQRSEIRSFTSWVELLSGVYFLFFITIHLVAIALTRYFLELQTDFFWAASLFASSSMRPFIIGFHFLGILSIMLHVGLGLKYWGEALGMKVVGDFLFRFFALTGFAGAALICAAYAGVFYPIEF